MTTTTASILAGPIDEYTQQFRNHQDLVQAHLIGKCDESKPLLPSFFPPASFWTSSEKDLFFHGLSIFSRLRPDLIAEHIKTKSTFDVCVYLDALHGGSLQECPLTPIREAMEPAMEVSERWAAHEEMLSKPLALYDTCSWSVDTTQLDVSRSQNRCFCLPELNLDPNADTQGSVDRAERDSFLSHLDLTSLVVMERLIREAESEVDMEDNVPYLTADSGAMDIVPEDGAAQMSKQSPGLAENDNELIDPNLSDSEEMGERISHQQKELRHRLKKRLYMRRKRAEQAGRTVVTEGIKLRPGRQKKPRKQPKPRPKTYNTKKKAILASNVENVSAQPSPKPEAETPAGGSISEQTDDSAEYESHSKGGATKPYRIQKLCLENGLDAQALVGMDLNFFHLSTVSRLLRLYSSLDESPRDLESVSISASTLQLLVRITTEFVSDIIRRTIITKEQEVRLKQSLKVWKYDRDEINAGNVAECLNSMGVGKLSKDNLFSRILEGEPELEPTRDRGSPSRDLRANVENASHNELKYPTDSGHPAQFILPQSLLWCSLPSYHKIFSSDDIPLPKIDEEALKQELEEEDNLDKEDQKRSKQFEKLLWDQDMMNLENKSRNQDSG